jgi:hypothetical protein
MVKKMDTPTDEESPASKSKPSRRKKSEYLPAPFNQMLPLHPNERALIAAEAAFRLLAWEYPEFIDSWDDGAKEAIERAGVAAEAVHRAYFILLGIAHAYWYGCRVRERKPRAELNLELEKIQRAVVQLQDSLKNSERVTEKSDLQLNVRSLIRGRLNIWLRRTFRNNPSSLAFSLTSDIDAPLQMIEFALKELAAACIKSVEKGPGPGNRPKSYLTKAAADLVGLWCRSGKKFVFRFDDVEGRDPSPTKEFASESVQFVWKIMRAIDPELSMGEVGSALKKVSGKRAAMSRNSTTAEENF